MQILRVSAGMSRLFIFVLLILAVACSSCIGDGSRRTGDGGGYQFDAGNDRRSMREAMLDNDCATGLADGLSRQILAELQCMMGANFGSIADLEAERPGLYPFMQQSAADALHRAVRASGITPRINSVFRTVVQQYLLYSWAESNRCSISIAAEPGNSNHETGLAFDVSNYAALRPFLEPQMFRWLGAGDPVHFDFIAPGTEDWRAENVRAFQRIWNRANPNDRISEDGAYGPMTKAKIEQSPVVGFASFQPCAQ